MAYILRFGHHLSTLAHLARGQRVAGEHVRTQHQTDSQPTKPQATTKARPQGDRAPKGPAGPATDRSKARPVGETLQFLYTASRQVQNHTWIKESLKTIDRVKLSEKLRKVIRKVDQNLLLTTSSGGKAYAT